MKKTCTFLLALALVFTLCACGNDPAPEVSATVAPTASPTSTPAAVNTELGSGSFESFEAAFVGAESFTAADGSDALRVYFDFKNRSGEAISASEWLLFSAVQDGKTLNWAESPERLDIEDNLMLRLQPDHSIRCVLQYTLLSDSTVAIMLSDTANHSVSALISLHQLPGAPAEMEAACDEPDETALTTTLPAECTLFDLYTVSLTGGETQDTDAGRVLVATLDFTNQADPQTVEVWDCLWLYAYQDGLELTTADLGTDFHVTADAGETVACTIPLTLRSESPVLIEVYGMRDLAPSAALVIPVA